MTRRGAIFPGLLVVVMASCGDDDAPRDAGHDGGPDAGPPPATSVLGSGPGFQAETAIAARDGVIAIAYMDQRASSLTGATNAARIQLVVSGDDGLAFGAPRELGEGDFDRFDPMVALAPSGRAYVGWFEDDGGTGRHVRVAAAADASSPFTLAPPLDDGSSEVDRPWLAAAADERVYSAWHGAPARRITAARSDDMGASFSPVAMTPDGGLLTGCVATAPGRAVFIVANQWEGVADGRIVVARSDDGGGSFTPAIVATGLGTGRENRVIAQCAVTPGGGLVVVWAEHVGGAGPGDPTLFDARLRIARSDDGVTFDAPVDVPAPAGAIVIGLPAPAVAVDDAGAAYVLFYTRSASGSLPSDGWRVFVTRVGGTPSGLTAPFTGLVLTSVEPPVGDITRWPGDTVALAYEGGSLHAAFAVVEADADVHYARIDPSTL